jgi:mono/diheme cytochrome c family protein
VKKRLGIILSILTGGAVVLSHQACSPFALSPEFLENSNLASEALTDAEIKTNALNLFQQKCVACHNATYSSGTKLSYMDDLNKLAASNYVVAGDLYYSLLYDVVSRGVMPQAAPLSSAEVKIVGDWIMLLTKPQATPTPSPQASASPSPTVSPTPKPSPSPSPSPSVTPTPSPTPSPAPTANPNATYSYINANIFQPKCAGCHGSSGGVSYASYAGATSAKSLTKGDPVRSNTYTSTKSGSMPVGGGAKLTDAETELIRIWILNGALNN